MCGLHLRCAVLLVAYIFQIIHAHSIKSSSHALLTATMWLPCSWSSSASSASSSSAASSRSPLLAAAPHPGRLFRLGGGGRGRLWGNSSKMVIVVRRDLGMGAGKIAAQAAHAAVELCRKHCTRANGVCNRWYNTGAKKVVLRVNGERELDRIAADARRHGLPVAVVHDAGKTQVTPGSKTAVSILGDSFKVDQVTGKLRLF